MKIIVKKDGAFSALTATVKPDVVHHGGGWIPGIIVVGSDIFTNETVACSINEGREFFRCVATGWEEEGDEADWEFWVVEASKQEMEDLRLLHSPQPVGAIFTEDGDYRFSVEGMPQEELATRLTSAYPDVRWEYAMVNESPPCLAHSRPLRALPVRGDRGPYFAALVPGNSSGREAAIKAGLLKEGQDYYELQKNDELAVFTTDEDAAKAAIRDAAAGDAYAREQLGLAKTDVLVLKTTCLLGIEDVLRDNSLKVASTSGRTFEQMALALVEEIDIDRLAPALHHEAPGSDAQRQEVHAEIKKVLLELGVLQVCAPALEAHADVKAPGLGM